MGLEDIQKQVDEWVQEHKIGYWQPHEILARLTEEVGELAREINHLYGPKKKKENENTKELSDELGDIMFTVCCLANSKEINLDESFQRAMNKCYERDNNRYEKK